MGMEPVSKIDTPPCPQRLTDAQVAALIERSIFGDDDDECECDHMLDCIEDARAALFRKDYDEAMRCLDDALTEPVDRSLDYAKAMSEKRLAVIAASV